ncbi:MAG: LamG-like jellyroll fold domain-containing protein, partial [Candidatus Acidiferrales bacterium]
MNPITLLLRRCGPLLFSLAALSFFPGSLRAQIPVTNDPPQYGPYNGVFLAGGDGLRAAIVEHDTVLRADSAWSIYCWVRVEDPLQAATLVAGMGDTAEEYPRYLGADARSIFLWMGKDNTLTASVALTPAKWHLLAATFDLQEFHLYADGAQVASGALTLGSVSPVIQMAPPALPWT